ncbi:MAG: carbohydrate-binding protein [Bryobacteraceae bacterium]
MSSAFAVLCLWTAGSAPASAQVVSVWLTTDDQKTLMAPQPPVEFTPGTQSQLASIYISESQAEQTIEGFGASMTDSAAYLLNEVVPKAALGGVMQSLFSHSQGIGVSFLRNPMGASDIARYLYSYDDTSADSANSSLPNFSISHDQADILPLLLQAQAINPQIKMLGTPWSPPAWMKGNDSMLGGTNATTAQLLPAQYAAFANYLVKYVQAYAATGVPVDYLTIQNEPLNVPEYDPGESMPATSQLTILKNNVLPALAAANITTKILVYDHNWDTPSYPETVFGDAALAASPQIAGVAWHWYGGPPGSMTTLHNLYPQFGQYVTEASGGTWINDEVITDFEMIIHSMRNWSRSYVKWSLALDQNRGPYIPGGCGTCSGLITVNNPGGAVTKTIDYYTLGHFSKFVLPGAVRVWSNNALGLISAAFVNPPRPADGIRADRSGARDRSRALVVYNDSTSPQAFQIVWYGKSFQYSLPSYAGATFQWDASPEYSCRPKCWTPAIPATTVIQASSYNQISGLQTEPCTDAYGGFDLGYASPGDWAEYRNLDFGSGVHQVAVRVANNSGGTGTIEFHAGSPTGPLIAQATIPNTGGWQTWTTVMANASGASGVQDLFVVFQNGNLNWFEFQ